MRIRSLACLAALALGASAMTGCAASGDQAEAVGDCTPEYAGGTASRSVHPEGELASMTEAGFQAPLVSNTPEMTFVTAGDGERRAAPGDIVVAQASVFSGTTGELLDTTTQAEGSSGLQLIAAEAPDDADSDADSEDAAATAASEPSQLQIAATCMAAGSRVVLTSTMSGLFGSRVAPGTEHDTAVVVLDASAVYPGRAEGTPKPASGRLPSIALAPDGRPGLTFTGQDAPDDLVVETSIEGSGPVVEEGDTVLLEYTGVTWEDEAVFDSSWEKGQPAQFQIADGQLIDGVVQGLVGQRIGSQVVMSIPQELAYNDPSTRPSSIPEGAHLVFVFDLLGIL